ncbi:MAG: 50S ribosomal protein L18 [Candidatus Yanofskybacteria bacterium]|nr:50S ribosomal protein L18 [Candidatus Yanofskybacteria bacterium]
MAEKTNKIIQRRKRHIRVRAKISGTEKVPRISVFRSAKHVYVQAVNDTIGKTVFSASDSDLKEKNKIKKSFAVGEMLGQAIKKEGISKILFDRGGFKYHGRIKALADGLRSAGLKF